MEGDRNRADEQELLDASSMSHFGRDTIAPLICAALFFGLREDKSVNDSVVLYLLFLGGLLGGLVSWSIFLHKWLAIATLKTPQGYRGLVHLLGAIAIPASLPLGRIYDPTYDPVSAVSHALIYLEHHGFFALKLVALGACVALVAFILAKDDEVGDFPRYPLRWYALLSVGSAIAGSLLTPENDRSSLFNYYERTAYYVGSVATAYLGFSVGVALGRSKRAAKARTT